MADTATTSKESATKQAMIYVCGGNNSISLKNILANLTFAQNNKFNEIPEFLTSECHAENEMKPRDPIRCRDCGYRIMYKKRTKRLVVFDAR